MSYPPEAILNGLIITLVAGLATGIGSAIAFFARRANYRFLAVALGFSAGVMIYVSFVEILRKAEDALVASLGAPGGNWAAVGAFLGGLALMGVVDRLIPSGENPHEVRSDGDLALVHQSPAHAPRLMRMGLFTALAITVHNFPEGIATFLAAVQDVNLGIAIAVAVAIHNIPEGISVSVPIFFASGNRRRAFLLSLLSGLTEFVGALVGFLLLSAFQGQAAMGAVFAAVAGVMVYISLDELLPTAREYGRSHEVLYGLLGGMAVMAVSLLLLK